MKKEKLICDFCGIDDSAQNPVIAGENATICQSCAKSAYDIIEKHKQDSSGKGELVENKFETIEQNILTPESQSILAMENYKGSVHMEPAMMMGDRFEGHIVQGHIDCLGTITNIIQNGNSTDFFISIPSEYMKYVISKGSICVDGISLTVNEVKKDEFRLTIIPHTLENTLFKTYMINSKVNIETDMFARYVFNMFKKSEDTENISWDTVDNIMSNY